MGKDKVAIIGSGNWCVSCIAPPGGHRVVNIWADSRGSAIAKIAGQNAKKHSDLFEERTPIWVFEEDVRISLCHGCCDMSAKSSSRARN